MSRRIETLTDRELEEQRRRHLRGALAAEEELERRRKVRSRMNGEQATPAQGTARS